MRRARALRIGGFVGALCASAALIGASVSGTGAYFTDSHTGEIDAGTGHVNVAISPADGKLSFADLLPGDYKTQDVTYVAHGTASEDIWLVLPTTGEAEALVGHSGDEQGGGLGKYGHFAVSSTNGAAFTSYNLNGRNPSDTASLSCHVDANGEGGSDAQAADRSGTPLVPYCAVPTAILLASDLTDGQGGTATFTFGYTPLMHAGQDATLNKLVSYSIVATQHGIRPDDVNN